MKGLKGSSKNGSRELVISATFSKCIEAVEDKRDGAESFKRLVDAVTDLLEEEDSSEKNNFEEEKASPNWEKELLNWFREGGGECHKHLGLKSYGVEGNGMEAVEGDIEKDEQLFKIPHTRVISEQTVVSDPGLAKLKSDFALLHKFPSALLALFVVVETERAKSSWAPYLKSLPTKYSVPLYWSWNELFLLRGSPAFAASHQMWKNCVRMYAFVKHLLTQNAKSLGIKKVPSFRRWRWAMSIVFTRQNSIPVDDNKSSLALIPVWDMCNHEVGGVVTTGFDSKNKTVVCGAMRHFAKGEQVFIFYGNRSSLDLLVHNGFIPESKEGQENVLDYVLIRLSLNQNDGLFEKKKALLQDKQKFPTTIDFGIRRDFNANCPAMTFARISRLKQVESSLDPLKMISKENERDACDLITMALKVQLKKMDLLASEEKEIDVSSYHAKCALRLREIEKNVVCNFLKGIENYKKTLE